MDRKDVARKIRDALFDHINNDHGCRRDALQGDLVDAVIEKVLAAHLPPEVDNPWLRPACGGSAPMAIEQGPTTYTVTAIEMPSPGPNDMTFSQRVDLYLG